MHGHEGIGKTTLLTWLSSHLGKDALYVNKDVVKHKKNFLDALLKHSLSVVEKMTKPHEKLSGEQLDNFVVEKLRKHPVVLLVDDAHELSQENKILLRQLAEHLQVIIAVEKVLKEYNQYGEDELDLELKHMDTEELRHMLAKRIALVEGIGIFPFQEEDIQELAKKAKHQPVKLLSLARDRAIDLSLKVESLPPREKTHHEQPTEERKTHEATRHTTKHQEKPKKKWFSIQLVKSEEEKEAYLNSQQESKKEPEYKDEPNDDLDIDLLNKIVSQHEENGRK